MAASSESTRNESSSDRPLNADVRRTVSTTGVGALVGTLGIVLYAVATATTGWAATAVIGAGLLMSGAAAFVGALLGFLFGVPRTLQQARTDGTVNGEAPTEGAPTNGSSRPRYLVNTNLEQISDWLTKIIVGIGLTQLNTIPGRAWLYAGAFAPALGGTETARVLVLVLVVCFATDGFFFGYLLTRLFLTEAFMRAERGLEEIAEKVATAVAEKTSLQVDVRFIGQEMRSALYATPPDGFRRAIRLGERQTTQSGEDTPPEIWGLLACGYGQEYAWELNHGKRAEDLMDLRGRALAATRRAAADPGWKETLRDVWQPSDSESIDVDLVAFRTDPEFAKVLE